jgi:SAM-dependent methyltransferase
MQPEHLQELAELESTYWWHVAKRELITRVLSQFAPPPGLLVEGGIGSSRNLLEFSRLGYEVSGFDVMPEAIELGKQKGLSRVAVHDLEKPWPVEESSLRAVVLLDVIEHVEHPVTVLSHVKQALRSDGVVIVTVPAYQWLFSEWDRLLGHFRRYSPSMLAEQAQAAGLSLKWVTHWNSFTFPAAVAMRCIERLFPSRKAADFPRVSAWMNNMLLRVAGLERRLLLRIGVPFGLSIVGVLQHAEPR